MSAALGSLIVAIIFAVVSVAAAALAEMHPTPSQTAHIPVAIAASIAAVLAFLFSVIFFLIGLLP